MHDGLPSRSQEHARPKLFVPGRESVERKVFAETRVVDVRPLGGSDGGAGYEVHTVNSVPRETATPALHLPRNRFLSVVAGNDGAALSLERQRLTAVDQRSTGKVCAYQFRVADRSTGAALGRMICPREWRLAPACTSTSTHTSKPCAIPTAPTRWDAGHHSDWRSLRPRPRGSLGLRISSSP